jgi:hypothetical protein
MLVNTHVSALIGARQTFYQPTGPPWAPLMKNLLIDRPTDPREGQVLTKHTRGKRTVLALTFNEHEAEALRRLCSHIIVKAGRKPSMSLLARRGLQLFAAAYRNDPAHEVAVMSRMVSDDTVPVAPARRSPAAALAKAPL